MDRMTDEQINIAIAESLGWKLLANNRWTRPCGLYADLPNYTSDLNAMHEAMLLHPRKNLLRDFLLLEVLKDPTNKTNEPAWATAKQWATAYVNSLGKWIE